jgi:hypothetical protein
MRSTATPLRAFVLVALLGALGALPLAGTGAGLLAGPTGGDVLMLEKIVDATEGDAAAAADQVNEKDVAVGLGLTVDVVTDEQWAGMTAADFAAYKAIVLGDPFCSTNDSFYLAAPVANTPVWGPSVQGNVVVHTFDAALHSNQDSGQVALMSAGIQAVVATPGRTGLYVSTSCYDGPTVAQVLDGVSPGWTFVPNHDWDSDVDCDTIYLAASLPGPLASLTPATLSGWGCSTHAFFSAWPGDFTVLGIISASPDEEQSEPGDAGRQARTRSDVSAQVAADDDVLDGVTGSPVLLYRAAAATPVDPPVIEPTFTG